MAERTISVGPLAERRLHEHGLTRNDLAAARWDSGAEVEGREFLRTYSTLPNGSRVVLDCAYDRPEHVVKFRILNDDE